MFKRVNAGLSRLWTALKVALPALLRDGAGLLAVGLISYGAWLLAPAAGYITGGVLLLAGVLLLSRKG